MSAHTYLVPTDTQKMLIEHASKCQNLGLILARYVPYEAIDTNNKSDWPSGKKNEKRKWRDGWLQDEICGRFSLDQRDVEWPKLIEASHDRWMARTEGAARFDGQLLGRLIVGLGSKGVLEFGLTLDYVTGLPIIPGSALKGVCRAYGLLVIAAQIGVPVLTPKQALEHKGDSPLQLLDMALVAEDNERDAAAEPLAAFNVTRDILGALPEAELFRAAFGSNARTGLCIFHDALISQLPPPDRKTLFRLDVMTPHFVKYYSSSGKEPPHDADNPNPVTFLTVSEGTQFAFAVSSRNKFAIRHDVQSQAATWLKAAISELGIGSKTASGYGAFTVTDN